MSCCSRCLLATDSSPPLGERALRHAIAAGERASGCLLGELLPVWPQAIVRSREWAMAFFVPRVSPAARTDVRRCYAL